MTEWNKLQEEMGWGSTPTKGQKTWRAAWNEIHPHKLVDDNGNFKYGPKNGWGITWEKTHPEEEVDKNGWPVNSGWPEIL